MRNVADRAHIRAAHREGLLQLLGNDLRHAQARAGFQALGQGDQQRIRLDEAGIVLQLRAQNLCRQSQDHQVRPGQRRGRVRGEVQVVGELNAREVAGVLAGAFALGHGLLVATDEGHAGVVAALASGVRRDLGEGRAPATRAENRNGFHGG